MARALNAKAGAVRRRLGEALRLGVAREFERRQAGVRAVVIGLLRERYGSAFGGELLSAEADFVLHGLVRKICARKKMPSAYAAWTELFRRLEAGEIDLKKIVAEAKPISR